MNDQNVAQHNNSVRRTRWQFVIAVIILIVCFLAYQLYRSHQFHLVRTEPGSNGVSTISPSITFNFNQSLYKPSVHIQSDATLISSYSVSGKSVIVSLATPLVANSSHTIILSSVTSNSGHVTNASFSFTIKDISFNNLSAQQQAAILAQQTKKIPSRNNYAYVGTDSLINQGLSIVQLEDLKQGLFLYIQSSKQDVSQINIINPVFTPFDPHGSSDVASVAFTVSFGSNKIYTAKLEYHDLTVARLQLYDPQSSVQLYDSEDIDLQANPT